MKFFLHDTNAFLDEKITELFTRFGYEGIGLFFVILERLAAQEKPIKTTVLKKQLFVGKKLEKVWAFIEEIGLISSENGETYNIRIISYLESYKKKKNDTRIRVSQHRERQDDTKNVTCYNLVSNTSKEKKNKEKKDTNAVEKPKTAEFDRFWNHYDKKVGKPTTQKEWFKLTEVDQLAAFEAIDRYKLYEPISKFRKDPERYLKQRFWESDFEVASPTNYPIGPNRFNQAKSTIITPPAYEIPC